MKEVLQKRVAFITGASRGIGAAVARALAGDEIHVVLSARTIGGLESVDDAVRKAGGTATLVPLDLRDLDAVAKVGPALFERFGRCDILIGNAGMLGTLGPAAHASLKEWQEVFTVNVTANVALIHTLDPLLRAAQAGRVLFTTSMLAHAGSAYFGTYAASKAAMEMLVRTYAVETEKTRLRVNLIDPGPVDTAMLSQAFPGGFPGQTASPEDLTPVFLDLVSPACVRHGEVVEAVSILRRALKLPSQSASG